MDSLRHLRVFGTSCEGFWGFKVVMYDLGHYVALGSQGFFWNICRIDMEICELVVDIVHPHWFCAQYDILHIDGKKKRNSN